MGTEDRRGENVRRDPDPTEPCLTPNEEGTAEGIGIEDCEPGPPTDIALAPVDIVTINNLKMKQVRQNVGLVLRLANRHKVISLGQMLILSHTDNKGYHVGGNRYSWGLFRRPCTVSQKENKMSERCESSR